jgi:hypothetical protein
VAPSTAKKRRKEEKGEREGKKKGEWRAPMAGA